MVSRSVAERPTLETKATWESFFAEAQEHLEAAVSDKNLKMREVALVDPRLHPVASFLYPSVNVKEIKDVKVYPNVIRPGASNEEHLGRWLSFAAIYCPERVEWLLFCAEACGVAAPWERLPPVSMDIPVWSEHVQKVGWATPGELRLCHHSISEELDYPPLYVNVVEWSILTYNEELMDLLLKHGMPVRVQRLFVNKSLFRACYAGCLTSIRAMHVIWGDFIDKDFLAKTQGNMGDLVTKGENLTSLLCCGMHDHWRCCEWLISEEQWPADQVSQPSGDNLLHILVEKAQNGEDSNAMTGIQRLVRAGVPLDQKNLDVGHTPLMVAVWVQRWQFARELLRFGADATVVDKDGDNIGHCVGVIHDSRLLNSAEIDCLDLDLIAEVVRLVYANGLDIHAKNMSGFTAFDLVMRIDPQATCKSPRFAAALKHRMMCELIALGADLSRSQMSRKAQKKVQSTLQDAQRRAGSRLHPDATGALVAALRTPVAEIMGAPCRCFWCRPSPSTPQGDRRGATSAAAVGGRRGKQRGPAPARDRGTNDAQAGACGPTPHPAAAEEQVLENMLTLMSGRFVPEPRRHLEILRETHDVLELFEARGRELRAASEASSMDAARALGVTVVKRTAESPQEGPSMNPTPDACTSSVPSPASATSADSAAASAGVKPMLAEPVGDVAMMECVACQDSKADFIMQACGHRCYCRLCVRRVVHRTLQAAQDKRVERKLKPKVIVRTKIPCPLCRTEGMAVRELRYQGHIYD